MAEDSGDREEEATEKRKRDAREKGQVPRSKELGSASVLVSSAIGLIVFGPLIGSHFLNVMRKSFSLSHKAIYDPAMMASAFVDSMLHMVISIVPFMLLVAVLGFIGSGILGGFNFSWQAMQPKFSKLNPMSGFKRMFGPNALMELMKAITKFSVVAAVAFIVLYNQFDKVLSLPWIEPHVAIMEGLKILGWSAFIIAFSIILVVAFDVPYQLYSHAKQLRMTKQEIKDEYKETEGKPEVKGKIRQMQREMSQRRMMGDVPTADVVITNPTHYAVALVYDPKQKGAPKVVAKGVDFIAEQIKKVAIANQVEMLELPPLARSIYHTTEIGHEIPGGLYVAVAQVLAYVFQLRDFRKGKQKRPKKPKNIEIPQELQY